MRTAIKQSHTPPRVNNLRRKWSTIPKAAAFSKFLSRFTAWRAFCFASLTTL
jgi:hypothetical protein